ncbi:MAG: protein translocase subunit SecD [Parcubacteria group bacterium]|nr:protein translocase subunit SecD [Parcubacteria group bacterium]|tara:strand:+ start:586 stop:2283 length:1698 start_codon:yes stop_codon:yes gene_type:complete
MLNQKNKIRLAVLGIFLIAISAIILDFPETIKKSGVTLPAFFDKQFSLGLDLQGGAHLIYEADVSQIPPSEENSAVEGVRDVIERRVNSFGVAEPIVQTTKSGDSYRIIVELAGVLDVNQAINMIGETPLLEFKEQNPNPRIDLTEEQKEQLATVNADAKTKAKGILIEALEPDTDFNKLATDRTEDHGTRETGGDLGFVTRGLFLPEFDDVCFDSLTPGEIHPELVKTEFGYHILKMEEERGEGESYEVRCSHILIRTATERDFGAADNEWLYTGLTGKQLERAVVSFDHNTQVPQINLEFNDEGAALFANLTTNNIGRPIGIFLDEVPISVPTVQQAITNGQAVITGQFSVQEAKILVQRLNAGALPVPIELISQQTVGASLGDESVSKSLRAGIFGLIIISLFMILYYRLPGLTAVGTLLFYGLVILAIFKLIPVTLTLAGMAGFILSLGFAVDANILIFERLKEELKDDKPLSIAVDEGFKRAWPSIFDGNISTLITCLILIGFTTSLVKGFAVTLGIGILISMFSAMVVTKVVLRILIKIKPLKKNWLFGGKKVKKETTN